ncbi:MAG: hypothetical protein US83_C0002G0070 [Candidatus Falkowbacteria bacterium GW2011_GWC2_38_22]|uniref:Uncharacterized protein n=1 Tax=Candidatus Falkowbacteria bacterium GW2011_GWE1_38_31 TaxID=1618638 RepID=A0A0G0JVT7_9BACT|nr:MAG: hypothetical protein US73_C0007G0070 [Candidatus Falkowbacteria bacterium GW2011_GWF2_38_1205]KKQ61981.1 MAG: hypothetical protein US83_C0002G0070 [Candidatus Falkowbacteria bacterium GW2011_GWC2_38_22]KKQ63857.1 MAG: hypothetical protein US84_C0003G0047 [Candidatus Falkowbacteria bacterium GW2011_GWF1_38_22]KKQ66114.1 MAG: hypothetical protein US87_C0003G0047 [Candidatus Falkowbacteria bacterium GW2011_GWE2_38_254]KKQ70717.1 MAG: hypothetical protein US91_C0003G0047 [Candidatus Falkowb
MKKLSVLIGIIFMLIANVAMANGPVAPVAEGDSVVFPKAFIDTVYTGKGEVRCAYHDLTGKNSDQPMQQRGNTWVAPGGRGTDIHPYVLADGKKSWCKIEDVWSTDAEFVKWRKAGPCIHVK